LCDGHGLTCRDEDGREKVQVGQEEYR
jgi:hypothetical protein